MECSIRRLVFLAERLEVVAVTQPMRCQDDGYIGQCARVVFEKESAVGTEAQSMSMCAVDGRMRGRR